MLAGTSPDFYSLDSAQINYNVPYLSQESSPTVPVVQAGIATYDFRVNTSDDQSIDSGMFPAATHRFLVDRNQSYIVHAHTYGSSDAVTYVKALNASGAEIETIAVPASLLTIPDQSTSNEPQHFRSILGPAGTMLPIGTFAIEVEGLFRFGFVQDETYTFQSKRSVDSWQSPVFVPVNPSQPTEMALDWLSQDRSIARQNHSAGFVAFDEDRQLIEGVHVERFTPAVDTRLERPVLPGDQYIYLVNATGWANNSIDPRNRSLAWYGHRSSSGRLYADYTYTRNVLRDEIHGAWSPNAIQGNRITLNRPWAGPALPAGTAVRNAVDSRALLPNLMRNNDLVQTTPVRGEWTNGDRRLNQFPPGTAFIKFAAVVNESSVAEDETVLFQFRMDRNELYSSGQTQQNQRRAFLWVSNNDDIHKTKRARIESVSQPMRGKATIYRTGVDFADAIDYTAPPFFVGTDFFTYTVRDLDTQALITEQVTIDSLGGNLESDSALADRIRQNRVAANTTYTNRSYIATKNQALIVDGKSELGLNYDPTYAIAFRLERGTRMGSLSLRPDGTFDYIPRPGMLGLDTAILSSNNGSDERNVMLNIGIVESTFLRDQDNLRRVADGVLYQESAYRRMFYPGTSSFGPDRKAYLSWRVHILPYLGFQELYSQFRLNEPWDSPNNLPLLAKMPSVFRSANDDASVTSTRYQALANTVFPNPMKLWLNEADSRGNTTLKRDVSDSQNVILVVQTGSDRAVPWTKPDDLDFAMSDPIGSLGNVGPYFSIATTEMVAYRSRVASIPASVASNAVLGWASLAEMPGIPRADLRSMQREWNLQADYPRDPGLFQARENTASLQQIVMSMFNFESANRVFPPAPAVSATKELSWRVYLLPFLGYETLFNRFRLNEPWDSPHNLPLANEMPDIFRSEGTPGTSTTTRIHVLGGTNMPYSTWDLANRRGPRLSEISDGETNTIMVIEAGIETATVWTKPEVLRLDSQNPAASLGTFPNGRIRVAMFDWSILTLNATTAIPWIVSMATSNAGDRNLGALNAIAPTLFTPVSLGHPLATNDAYRSVMNRWSEAMFGYEASVRRYPSNIRNAQGTPLLSWRVAILPYIGESELYSRFRLNEPWDSPNNLPLLDSMPWILNPISSSTRTNRTPFQMFAGSNSVTPTGTGVRWNSIVDGTDNTLLLAVSGKDKAVPWTKPEDLPFDASFNWDSLGLETNSLLTVTASGRITSLSRNIGDLNLRGLITRDGGEPGFDLLSFIPNQDLPKRLYVIEGRRNEAFSISLPPNVQISLDDPNLVDMSVREDGFQEQFGQALRITVGAKRNNEVNGVRTTKLRISGGITPQLLHTIDVVVIDGDTAGVVIDDDIPNPMVTQEGGPGVPLSLSLATAPMGDVELYLIPSPNDQVSLSSYRLRFTPENWNQKQTVIVSAQSDSTADGNLIHQILLETRSNDDPRYVHFMADSVPFRTLDNTPPTFRLQNVVSSISEFADTSQPTRIADIQIIDDMFGNNRLVLDGADQDSFFISNNQLFLKAGVSLDFEAKSAFVVRVIVDDLLSSWFPEFNQTLVLSVIDENEPPSLTIQNVRTTLPESTDVTNGVHVATLDIKDDAMGYYIVRLFNPSPSRFALVGNRLFVKSNLPLDFETEPELRAVITVDDPAIGSGVESEQTVTIRVLDVNEPPSLLRFDSVHSGIPENTSTTIPLLVGTIQILDDALGVNRIQLQGPDASHFQLDGNRVLIRAGTELDFERKQKFSFVVSVDDPSVGRSPDLELPVEIAILNLNEPPFDLVFTPTQLVFPESARFVQDQPIGTFSFRDDELGVNRVSLRGNDANRFVIRDNTIFVLAGTMFDFESKPSYQFGLELDDDTVGASPDAVVSITVSVLNENEPPFNLRYSPLVTQLPEDHLHGDDVWIGELQYDDDSIGGNKWEIVGPEASRFFVKDGVIYLKRFVTFDYETQKQIVLRIELDDPDVGTSPDQSLEVVLDVIDRNDPPSAIDFDSLVTSLPEYSRSENGWHVANIRVVDDALGVNQISLAGFDVDHFRLDGTKLIFAPNDSLKFQTRSSYSVLVRAQDESFPSSVLAQYRVSIGNIPEVTSVSIERRTDPTPNDYVAIRWDSPVDVLSNTVRFYRDDIETELVVTQWMASGAPDLTLLKISGPNVENGLLKRGTYHVKVDRDGVTDTISQLKNQSIQSPSVVAGSFPALPNIDVSLTKAFRANAPGVLEVHLRNSSIPPSQLIRFDVTDFANRLLYSSVSTTLSVTIRDLRLDVGSHVLKLAAYDRETKVGSTELVLDVSPAPNDLVGTWTIGLDTNRDGAVDPLDVLALVNHINNNLGNNNPPYLTDLDVDFDRDIGPLDVLKVVNYLNRSPDDRNVSPFDLLTMTNTGLLDGFTSRVEVLGKLKNGASGLWLRLDGGEKKNASHYVATDGVFALPDSVMAELFGPFSDGEHRLTISSQIDGSESHLYHRSFFKSARVPSAVTIKSSTPNGNNWGLEWDTIDQEVTFEIVATPIVNGQRGQSRVISRTQYRRFDTFRLEPGVYELHVVAKSAAQVRTSSAPVRVNILT